MQLFQETKQKYTVSELNNVLKTIVEDSYLTQDIWVSGEITQVNFYQNGNHVYFNLSDGDATINCVIYNISSKNINSIPAKGQHIFARGSVNFYHKKGSLIFQVAYFSDYGKGKKHEKLQLLTQQLEKEGLFDVKNKLAIPHFPKTIAMITSPESAAMWDFVTAIRSITQFPRLILIPTTMQGTQSDFSIIESLDFAIKENVDLIAIIRGGGSVEDLSTFNREIIVRKIFDCPIPVITGIGHKTDLHLCDLVSDLNCATPTACAEHIGATFKQIKLMIEKTLTNIRNKIDIQINETSKINSQTLFNISTRCKHYMEHIKHSIQFKLNLLR